MQSSEDNVHVVIPARYGSQRLPGKPLIDLAGRPMVVRVFDSVAAAFAGLDVVVAVDDRRVLEVLDEYGVPAVMSSSTCASGTDRVAEVARAREWSDRDLVVNVQGDEPLMPVDLLGAFARFCTERDSLAMATVAVPITRISEVLDPNVVKVTVRASGSAITFSRSPLPFDRDHAASEWNPSNYRRHVGIYAYRNSVLQRLAAAEPCNLEELERLEQLRALWLDIPIEVMDWDVPPPGGVDTPDDVRRVVAYLEAQNGV